MTYMNPDKNYHPKENEGQPKIIDGNIAIKFLLR